MKTTIYYFSGTGNSLKVAQDLSVNLGDTELISIAKAIKEKDKISTSADTIGIVYPVYMWGIPKIVDEFIKQLSTENKGKYFFAVATNGGRVAGSLLQLSKKLSSRGFKLSLGASLVLPSNYTPKHAAPSLDKQELLFSAAKERSEEIALLIKNKTSGSIEKGSAKDCIIRTGFIYGLASLFIHSMDKNFWTDDNCISCGLCEKICPVQSIKFENGKPVWLHNCEQCLRCLNYCPKASIQFGKSTMGKERYKNPVIKLNDLIKD